MWLKSYAHAKDVYGAGYKKAGESGHADQIRYWRVHQPIVMGLIANSTIFVACDPARATNEPGRPAVIWAWACVTDDVVHWVGVKRNAVEAGIGPDLVRALLGDRLTTTQATTFELTDLYRLKMIPEQWVRDRGWLSALRSASIRMLDRDGLFTSVATHVLDTRREEWRQSTERAA
jgi:hypothetical protein